MAAPGDSFPLLPLGFVQPLPKRGFGPAFLFPQANMASGADRVFWGWQERFEITVLSSSGEVLRLLSRPHERVAVTEEIRASLIDEMIRTSWRGRALPNAVREVLEPMMRGDSLPAFSNSLLHRMQVDQVGNLWVPSFRVGSTPAEKWTVFSGDGTWLGEVAGLPHLRILEIGLDRVVGLARDELDVQHIEVHRIVHLDDVALPGQSTPLRGPPPVGVRVPR